MLEVNNLKVRVEDKEILRRLNLTVKTGGVWERATDPVAGFAADGTAYINSFAFNRTTGDETAVVVHRSDDGGLTWEGPFVVDASDTFRQSYDKNWMAIEADRLSAAHAVVLRSGFTVENREEMFRAAHDIKGDAATFGFPSAGAAAESLCRIIEHAPDLDEVPADLITHHINAIQAIVRERTKLDTAVMASALSKQLRGVADEFLVMVNRDRPEHLEAILAPSIVPAE